MFDSALMRKFAKAFEQTELQEVTYLDGHQPWQLTSTTHELAPMPSTWALVKGLNVLQSVQLATHFKTHLALHHRADRSSFRSGTTTKLVITSRLQMCLKPFFYKVHALGSAQSTCSHKQTTAQAI